MPVTPAQVNEQRESRRYDRLRSFLCNREEEIDRLLPDADCVTEEGTLRVTMFQEDNQEDSNIRLQEMFSNDRGGSRDKEDGKYVQETIKEVYGNVGWLVILHSPVTWTFTPKRIDDLQEGN